MEPEVKNHNTNNRKSRISNPTPYSGLGKLPPQAVDLEEAVLGAMLLEKNAILSVHNILKPEAFYKDCHQKIYSTILNLFEKSSPVDILTVTAQLRQQGELEMIGGAYYITELTNRVASAANIEFHSRIIIQKFIQRELIRISTEVINSAYEDTTDVLELQSNLSLQLSKIYSTENGKGFTNAADLLPGCVDQLFDKPDYANITGVSSGLESLDEITGGWQNSDLVIVAARPAMGKTAFMLHALREAAIYQGQAVGVFSLEMSSKQLVDRLISAEANISMNDIKFRNLNENNIKKLWEDISGIANATILIDDTAAINITDLRAKAIRMKHEAGIKMLFIDYLGLMRPAVSNRNSNRTNDIGEISRALKSLAKELDIPVIALCQLNRSLEARSIKIPMLNDLRDSGDIEQDADMVIFLYRPEYYDITEDHNGSTEKKCYLAIAKHRNGSLGIPGVYFDAEYMKFEDQLIDKQPF